MAIEAISDALEHSGLLSTDLAALWIGTESKPYAVKPSAVIVAEAIGTTSLLSAADVEFA